MARFHPQATTINVIPQRPCPHCGLKMMLARIEPSRPGFDLRTFECRECDYTESVVAKI